MYLYYILGTKGERGSARLYIFLFLLNEKPWDHLHGGGDKKLMIIFSINFMYAVLSEIQTRNSKCKDSSRIVFIFPRFGKMALPKEKEFENGYWRGI